VSSSPSRGQVPPDTQDTGAPDTGGPALIAHLRRLAAEKQVVIPEFLAPHEADVHTGRLRQHYLDWGKAGAPAVVFLHAGRLNAHSWDLVCLALRDRYRCLSVDLAGHGDSAWAADGDYRVATSADDLRGFADALGLKKFLLVGLSMGGMHALAFAGRHPERLYGLVIMDIGPEVNPEGTRRQREAMAVFEPMAEFEDFVRLALADRPTRNADKLRFTIAQNVRQQADGRWVWKYDVANRSRQSHAQIESDRRYLAEIAPDIACPTLVLRGESSDILLREHAARLAARVQRGRWAEIPGARHFLHLDNPVAVIAELERFFGETPAD
jgi:esterase